MAVGVYDLGWSIPCGGMSSTTHDLNVLAQAIMGVAPSSQQRLLRSQGLAHALVAPLYMNAGGKTLFGTPWEMNVHPNTGYLVRRKGGNVPGYTALLAFVPEIKLSLSVLWSGGTDELGASEQAMDLLLPPLNDMFREMEHATESTWQPTNQSVYVGTFQSSNITGPAGAAQVFVYKSKLLIKIDVLGVGMYLRVPPGWSSKPRRQVEENSPLTLQMWVSRTVASCLSLELQASVNQYVVFNEDLSSFSVPGLVPGYVWERQ